VDCGIGQELCPGSAGIALALATDGLAPASFLPVIGGTISRIDSAATAAFVTVNERASFPSVIGTNGAKIGPTGAMISARIGRTIATTHAKIGKIGTTIIIPGTAAGMGAMPQGIGASGMVYGTNIPSRPQSA
jgi:hypothetical protein